MHRKNQSPLRLTSWQVEQLKPITHMTDHLFLPEKEDLDKLLRYEGMINRQLNHAIGELERVQARRKGEAPPANA